MFQENKDANDDDLMDEVAETAEPFYLEKKDVQWLRKCASPRTH